MNKIFRFKSVILIFAVAFFAFNLVQAQVTAPSSAPKTSSNPQSCVEKGCGSGLECIQFPGNDIKCAKPNPCSYYQCPLGTRCYVNMIKKADRTEPGAIPSTLQLQSASEDIEQVIRQDSSMDSGYTESKSVVTQPSYPSIQGGSNTDQGSSANEILPQEGGETAQGIIEVPANISPLPVGISIVGCASGLVELMSASVSSEVDSALEDVSIESGRQAAKSAREKTAVLQTQETTEKFNIIKKAEVRINRVISEPSAITTPSPVPEIMESTSQVSIWEGSSGEISILQTSESSAEYNGKIVVEEDKLYIETLSGKKQLEVLPEVAVQAAEASTKQIKVQKIELKEDANSQVPVYEVKAVKAVKLFGFMPMTIKIETNVSAENGKVISVKKPWWSFLTR